MAPAQHVRTHWEVFLSYNGATELRQPQSSLLALSYSPVGFTVCFVIFIAHFQLKSLLS